MKEKNKVEEKENKNKTYEKENIIIQKIGINARKVIKELSK